MSCVRIFVNELHSLEWLGILLARIAVGLLFFLSGRGKLFVPERREQMRRTLIEAHVPFSGFQRSLCFNRRVCLRVLAYYWGLDATGLRAARLRDGSGDCDDSNSQYQSVFVSGVARGISVSPRAALSGDSDLAILLRARMAQR